MNITREDMPGRQVALTIELEPETVNTALDRAYRQMVNQVNIPGFRRGKAPRHIVERYLGTETLTEQAVKNILPQTVQDAITEQNLEALDVSDFEIVNTDPLQVKVIVVQPPLIELGDYGSIRVEKEQVEVTTEQVEEVLLQLRRESAPWNEPAEPRPIKEDDMVYLDLEGFTSAGELPEAKRENFPTIVGMAGMGVPEAVSKALVGMSVEEEKDITETLPDDYPVEEMRSLDVSYHITTHSMKEQQLPEMDDEYAKVMGFDTTEVLRETVERNLRQRVEESAESEQIDKAITQMVERSKVEIPDVLVTEELDDMLKSLENRIKEQRITLRQYFTFGGITEGEWRESNRDRARERVVRSLVLQRFARREGISVEDEDVDKEVDTILDRFEVEEREKARELFTADRMLLSIQGQIYQRKLVDRLVGIIEGKIEAAPPPAVEGNGKTEESAPKAGKKARSMASDREKAGSAAKVPSAQGVDTRSEDETGDAASGDTPPSASALEAGDSQAQDL